MCYELELYNTYGLQYTTGWHDFVVAPFLSQSSLGTMVEESSVGEGKKPFRLPCGHVFCEECIMKYVVKSTSWDVLTFELGGGGGVALVVVGMKVACRAI